MSAFEIRQGDALEVLRQMPAESVQCCVTSPPYWGLRDYGADGQLGLESTPEEYVSKMVEVFREVRRVLRDDGTVWLNLGDSYNGVGRGEKANGLQVAARSTKQRTVNGLKPKDLCGIPWRVAFALQADGWYLRSDIIWSKPNPMPESVTDRPTKAHEYIFLLSKRGRYYYDADAIAEPHASDGRGGFSNKATLKSVLHDQSHAPSLVDAKVNPNGRNKRTVWTVTTKPYSDAHFATFPPKLIEPCVLAGTSEKGCCVECGAGWVRVVERHAERTNDNEAQQQRRRCAGVIGGGVNAVTLGVTEYVSRKTTGWRPACECPGLDGDHPGSACADSDNWATEPCTVLDPFAGSGTTGMVALRAGRNFVGIELNPEYCEMARGRILDDAPLFNEEREPITGATN